MTRQSKGMKAGETYTRTRVYVDPVSGQPVKRVMTCAFQPKGSRAGLEPEVRRLAGAGLRYHQIAAQMGITLSTVKAVMGEYAIPYAFAGQTGRPKQS